MRRTLLHPGVLAALALVQGCGPVEVSNGTRGRPQPAPVGAAVSERVRVQVETTGGVLESPDHRLTVAIPASSIAGPLVFEVQEVANTAPRGIGPAYRLGPEGTWFSSPISISFDVGQEELPIEQLGIAYQDERGYWVPVLAVLRNRQAKVITALSHHFSGWALVPTDPTRDMAGSFTVTSSLDVPLVVKGSANLGYAGEDATKRYYLMSGQTTLEPVTYGGNVCTPDAATRSFPANLFEVFTSPAKTWWGTSGHWNLTCGGTPVLASFAFDNGGLNYLRCTRGPTDGGSAEVVGTDQLSGDYTIDCSSAGGGMVRGVWDFVRCETACASGNPCAATATISCTSLPPSCTVTTLQPAGTPCTSGALPGTCTAAGICNTCTGGDPCTPTDPCVITAAIGCGSGVPICTGQTFEPAGTACTLGGVSGVCTAAGVCTPCTQGAACTSANPCAATATTDCTSGPVCVDQTFAPVATPCTTGGAPGVCNAAGVCVPCSQGAACTPTNPCAASGTLDCASGAPVCTDVSFVAAGTACTAGAVSGVCSPAGVCTACSPGSPCTSANPCAATAAIVCSSGAPVCVDQTFVATGTACSSGGVPGVCSAAGVCTACTQGAACASSNPCAATATIDCSGGGPVCLDQTFNAVGTACSAGGVPGVCNSSGVCAACSAGSACAPANPCALSGAIDCSSGAPVCVDQGQQPVGTSCTVGGVPGVCSPAGSCVACTQGAACASSNPCAATATTDCTTGAPVCVAQTYLAPGTPCGAGSVCNAAGVCALCPAGAACTSTNPCAATAAITCNTGAPVCTDASFVADATLCGGRNICLAGVCGACIVGTSCTPAIACHQGSIQCGGSPRCRDTGRSTCVAPQVCNTTTGQCQ